MFNSERGKVQRAKGGLINGRFWIRSIKGCKGRQTKEIIA